MSIRSGSENFQPLPDNRQPLAPKAPAAWQRPAEKGSVGGIATERRASCPPLLMGRKTSNSSISISVSNRSSIKLTSTSASPSLLRKLLTKNASATSPLPIAKDAISALKAGKGNHVDFNKHADVLKKSPDWQKAVERGVASLTIHERIQFASLDKVKLRGFDREVAHKILSCLKLSNQEELRASLAPEIITTSEKNVLGGGAVNTVYKVTYKSTEGGQKTEVFKPDPSGLSTLIRFKEKLFGTAVASGIPAGDESHLPSRAVASSVVESLLFPGNPISVQTRFATVDGQRGILMEQAAGENPRVTKEKTKTWKISELPPAQAQALQKRLGDSKFVAAMLKASSVKIEGDSLVTTHTVLNVDLTKPKTLEGLVMLQCLDVITGQVDRNPNNYHIDPEGNVKGIDQDCSFGIHAIPDDVDVRSQPALKMFIPNNSSLMLRMPPVITEYIQTSINSLHQNKDALRASLKGFITDTEVEATMVRLDKLHTHIQTCIVAKTPEGLASPLNQKRMTPDNSYQAREQMLLRQDQKGWNDLRKRFSE
jgi:hypothetical protein